MSPLDGAPRGDPEPGSPIRTHVRVRWSDADGFGHVNNAAYLRYFEDARFASFEASGLDAEGTIQATVMVVARQEIEYLVPLQPRLGTIAVDTWVTRIGRTSVDMAHVVWDPPAQPGDEGRVYARSRSRMVSVTHQTGIPAPLAEHHRTQLAQHTGPPLTFRTWG